MEASSRERSSEPGIVSAPSMRLPALLLAVCVSAFPGAARATDPGTLAAFLSSELLLAPVCEESMCDNFDRMCRRCGQPATTGTSPKSTDALRVLQAAVGQIQCVRCVCDVDGSGSVQATDALTTLRIAVGLDSRLNCPEG